MSWHVLALAQAGGGGWVDPIKIGVGVVIFAAVAVAVVALFGQRGKAEVTPERQVALATGHADRRTVFESPALQPLMWLLLYLGGRISGARFEGYLRRNLIAAGSPNFYTPREYVAVALLWGVVAALLGQLLNAMVIRAVALVIVPALFAAGFGACIYHLHGMAAKRVKLIWRRVPYTLDLIALAMGAGATFTEAVRTVVHEDREHPFNVELNTVLAEVELGTTRHQALRNMSDRIPLGPLRSIVAAIIQAERLGTALSDVLKEQASLMRLHRSVRAEKLAARASVRILVPSLLILISVVLTVFSPLIIRAYRGELF